MNGQEKTTEFADSNRSTVRLVLWGVAWLATLAIARFGPELWWDSQRILSAVAVVVNVIVGIAWIVAFTQFMRALDDLQRKIMLDALGVTLGLGWVVGFALFVADSSGLFPYEFNIAIFPAFLGVVFLAAYAIGKIRYR